MMSQFNRYRDRYSKVSEAVFVYFGLKTSLSDEKHLPSGFSFL